MKAHVKILLVFLIVILFLLATICGVFFLSFKTNYKNVVTENSKNYGVDMALIYAVIKAESKFNTNAKSKVGALGLMQVKLSTANYMLSQNDGDGITEEDLFDPVTNIKVGTMYLSYLMQKFSDLDVVICAYNAGETAVNGWLKNSDYSENGITLKHVPFPETDTYLRRVKFNLQVYSRIL